MQSCVLFTGWIDGSLLQEIKEMRFDENMMTDLLNTAARKEQRKILELLRDDPLLNYSELRIEAGYENKNSSLFAYHLHQLAKVGLIKKDKSRYFLTRVGLQIIHLLDGFRKICTTYDISDCDADGRILEVVIRR